MRDRNKLNKEQKKKISRRDFMGAAAAAAAFTIVPRYVLGLDSRFSILDSRFSILDSRRVSSIQYPVSSCHIPPSEKLNVACIGVGGMGGSDARPPAARVRQVSTENIVAFCDVDWKHAGGTFKRFPYVKKYRDFRRMLDKEGKNISILGEYPVSSIQYRVWMGKHVYCQKPLAHDVFELACRRAGFVSLPRRPESIK